VAEGFDAGVRLGDSLPADMIAVPLLISLQVASLRCWSAGRHLTADSAFII
jgi:hypothetical protein